MKLYELVLKNDVRPSPFCWRVKMMLEAKGQEYETVPVRFTDKHLLEPFGTKLVPVLQDGDRFTNDSAAIMEFLDSEFPSRKSIGDPKLQRFLNDWLQANLYPLMAKCVMLDIFDALDEADRDYFRSTREARVKTTLERFVEGREEQVPKISAALEPVRKMLGKGPFLGDGEEPSGADFSVFSLFMWVRCSSPFEVLPDASDPLHAWRERMLDAYGGFARKARRAV